MKITAPALIAQLVFAVSFSLAAGPATAQGVPAAAPADSAAAALVGKPAPDFTLPDQNNISRTLSRHRGKWVVLAFYPADKTRG